MIKDKETLAREYSKFQPSTKEGMHSSIQLENGYLAGFDTGQAQSAKLLAEKDDEIERLRSIKSNHSDVIDMKSRDLSAAKEFIKQMRDLNSEFITSVAGLRLQYFLKENTDKIKALLGEE